MFFQSKLSTGGISKTTKKHEGLELLAEMKQHGIEPDMNIYQTLIQTCARHGDVSAALKVRVGRFSLQFAVGSHPFCTHLYLCVQVMAMVEADGLPYTLPLLTTLTNVCSTQPLYENYSPHHQYLGCANRYPLTALRA